MKTILFAAVFFAATSLAAQPSLVTANKCYDAKDYACAAENYKKSIADKSHQEADRALILFRIGYSLKQLEKFDEAIKYLQDALVAKPVYGDAFWTLAGTYYAAGEYLSAVENYGKAIEQFKTEPASLKSLYYWRGKSYSAMEKYTDALTYLDLAIKTDSTMEDYHAAAGDAAFNDKKYERAVKYYSKAIAISTKDSKVLSYRYYWLAQSYYEQMKYEEALAANLKSLEYDNTNGSAQWSVAGVFYNQKKWPKAVSEYTKTIAMFKDDTASLKDLYFYRGKSYSGNKEYAKALADFDAMLRINPAERRANWQIASVYYEQKKYKEAVAKYSETIGKYKDEKNSLDDLYYFRGYASLKTKDTAAAIADFKESLKLNANLREPNVWMGTISFARKSYADARSYYSTGLPGYTLPDSTELAELWFKKGFSNFMSGNTYTAKDDLQKSIRYDSSNKSSHRYLGDLYYSEKSYSLTEKEMDKCLVLYKNVKDSLPKIYLYRGMARAAQQKYKDALADYEQSDKLKKMTDASYIVSMAQIAFEIKEYEKAIGFFNRVLPTYKPQQTNELVFAYFGRGRANLELKKKQPAINDLNKSLELSPGNKDIIPWLTKAQAL